MRAASMTGALYEPLIWRVTVAEFLRVLEYPKFRLFTADQHELIADYLPFRQRTCGG